MRMKVVLGQCRWDSYVSQPWWKSIKCLLERRETSDHSASRSRSDWQPLQFCLKNGPACHLKHGRSHWWFSVASLMFTPMYRSIPTKLSVYAWLTADHQKPQHGSSNANGSPGQNLSWRSGHPLRTKISMRQNPEWLCRGHFWILQKLRQVPLSNIGHCWRKTV